MYPYQYINRQFAKDWSNSLFNSDETEKIGRESFTVGTSLDKYFGSQIIDYNNTYTETIEGLNVNFELDLALLTGDASNNTSYCIVQYNDSKVIPSALSVVTGEWVYNVNMRLNTLIKDWYTYDRPFWEGTLYSQTDNSLSTELTLVRYYILETSINIPYSRHDYINDDLLLVTNYGNLKLLEINVNLQSGSAIITASKQ